MGGPCWDDKLKSQHTLKTSMGGLLILETRTQQFEMVSVASTILRIVYKE